MKQGFKTFTKAPKPEKKPAKAHQKPPKPTKAFNKQGKPIKVFKKPAKTVKTKAVQKKHAARNMDDEEYNFLLQAHPGHDLVEDCMPALHLTVM